MRIELSEKQVSVEGHKAWLYDLYINDKYVRSHIDLYRRNAESVYKIFEYEIRSALPSIMFS